MSKASTLEAVRTKYQLLQPLMTERLRRQWAACEAESLGRGGVTLVAEATGLSRTTIWAGRRELRRRADQPQDDLPPERVRAPGGGRHLVEQDDSALLTALRALVESSTRGDPQSPLLLDLQEHAETGRGTAPPGPCGQLPDGRRLARRPGLQPASQPQDQGRPGPPRSRCPVRVHQSAGACLPAGGPTGRLGGHEKEGIGRGFQEPGREWRRRGQPEEVRAKDFPDKQLGKAIP